VATLTLATLPVTSSFDNGGEAGSANRDQMVNHNAIMRTIAQLAFVFTSDGVLRACTLAHGTTNTLSIGACVITIAGVPVLVAASANQSLSASSALPAGLWTCVAVDAVAAGTISFAYSSTIGTGQATEALAITDALTNNAKTTNKARIGYFTVQAAAAATWTAGTDGLAGGSGGTAAQTTNYYPICSPFELTVQSANAIALGSIGFTAKQIGQFNSGAITA
jgi:hypothetical protein